MVSFTGCGFASPGKDGEGNRVCNAQDGDFYHYGTGNNKKSESVNGFWSVKLDPTLSDYGLDPKSGVTIFRDIAIMMYESIFMTTWATDNFQGDSMGALNLNPVEIIKFVNSSTAEIINEGGGPLSNAVTAIQSLACAVLIAIWFMGFISQVVNEKFTIETLLKSLMQLLCGILLVTNAKIIVTAFANAGSALVNAIGGGDVNSGFTGYQDAISSLLTDVTSYNIGFSIASIFTIGIGTVWIDINAIIAILFMIFPFIILVMVAYKILSIMIMRMLELTIRIALAPIPIAFGAQSGFGQDSIRYFRATMACAMEPALMLLGAGMVGSIGKIVAQIFGMDVSQLGLFMGMLAMGLSYLILNAYFGETKRLAKEIIAH